MTLTARRPRLVLIEEYVVEEVRVELTALIAEDVDFAARVVAIARRAQVRLARGQTPADLLDELETLALRHGVQRTAAAAQLRAGTECPDGVNERHSGHGRAA